MDDREPPANAPVSVGSSSLGQWFRAADPAGLRWRQGARAAGAAVSTGVTLQLAVRGITAPAELAVVLFGVAVCVSTALAILDASRRDRQTSLLLAGLVIAAVTVPASVIGRGVADNLVMLVLVFAAFAFRRWGQRAGELAMVATTTWYFAINFGVRSDDLGWFLLAVVVGIGWMGVWQFLIIPYEPEESLRRAVDSFLLEASQLVTEADEVLGESSRGIPVAPDRFTA